MTRKLKVLTQTEIYEKRLKIYNEQNQVCPVCNKKIKFEKSVLDHKHKLLKTDEIGKNGTGLVRGVLCFQCNSFEGKIFNAFKRYGLHKKSKVTIPFLLRNLADYLEKKPYPLIHPTEIKKKDISKKNYNTLKKLYMASGLKKRFPEYPKSRKITKTLKDLFEQFNIDPYNGKK